MLKTLFGFITIYVFALLLQASSQVALAVCTRDGQCDNYRVCECINELPNGRCLEFTHLETTCTSDFNYGQLEAPPGVREYNIAAGATEDRPAIIYFLSQMIRLATVLGGVWVVINIIIAAFFYITGSGDVGAHTKVRNLLTSSLVGLILIVGFYTMGAIIGLMFFGDATFILNPQL